MKRSVLLSLATIFLLETGAFAQQDLNLRNRHVFPHVVDGRLEDGTAYSTTIVITNPNSGWVHCTFWLVGLPLSRLSERAFWIEAEGVREVETRNSGGFDSGYAILECNGSVAAIITYRREDADGRNLGMTTGTPAPSTSRARVVVSHGAERRTGVALVNESLWIWRRYHLTLQDASGRIRDVRVLDLAPGGFIAKFVDELMRMPGAEFTGSLKITGGFFHAAATQYDGGHFAAVPVQVFSVYY